LPGPPYDDPRFLESRLVSLMVEVGDERMCAGASMASFLSHFTSGFGLAM
jgi:hypothetical protein